MEKIKKRIYAGAANWNSGLTNWYTATSTADAEIWASLRQLRNRARQLYRDTPIKKAVKEIVQNVIGTGLSLQCRIESSNSGNTLSSINSTIENYWKDWGLPEFCCASGKLSFTEAQQLIFRTIIVDGEVLVRKIYQGFRNSPIPFALEIIECDRLVENQITLNNGNSIRLGVENDEWGAPIAYWLYPVAPGDIFGSSLPKNASQLINQSQRIPAGEILHLFLTDRPNQSRGVPWLHAAIVDQHNLASYREAAIVQRRGQAAIMGIVTSPDPEVIGQENDQGEQIDYLEPGVIKRLAPGEEFTAFDPSKSAPETIEFIRDVQRAIAAAVGLSYESFTGDYSQTSFSSVRASILPERDNWRILQDWFATKVLTPIFKPWVLALATSHPREISLSAAIQAQKHHTWSRRGWSWVDPLKDVQAQKTAIENGFTTLTRVLAEQGVDIEDYFKERQKEIELAKKYGISLPTLLNQLPSDTELV